MRLRAVRTARKPRDSGRKAVKRVGYLTGAIRLRDKLAALWQKLQLARTESRRHDDPDRRPSPAHCLRKFYPIHRSRHVMSVNTILISSRLSRILMASSAFDAQSGSNPASRIMSTASIRIRGSSSTASTTGRWEGSTTTPFHVARDRQGRFSGSSVLQRQREAFDPSQIRNTIILLGTSEATCVLTWNDTGPTS